MNNVFIHGWSFSSDIWKNLYNGNFIDLPFTLKYLSQITTARYEEIFKYIRDELIYI